eukprot:3637743-Pyramimonas_sp.AAC.1
MGPPRFRGHQLVPMANFVKPCPSMTTLRSQAMLLNDDHELELMATGCNAHAILKPDGNPIPQKTSMIYLGSVLTCDGSVGAELSQRIGRARSEFDSLQRVWSHSSMSTKRKINVHLACVESTLLYSLHTSWLRQHELARLNAFQA